jgi:hypothetical protein
MAINYSFHVKGMQSCHTRQRYKTQIGRALRKEVLYIMHDSPLKIQNKI